MYLPIKKKLAYRYEQKAGEILHLAVHTADEVLIGLS